MRAFVTGATGFIGGPLARALRADGWDLIALVRRPEKAARLSELGVTIVRGDLTKPDGFSEAMRGCDVMFHLAAFHVMGSRDRSTAFRTNVDGTQAVLRAAGDAAVARVVHCSSTAAIGTGPFGSVGDETRAHNGRFASIYEESKWAAHQVAHRLASEGLPVVMTMPCAVYGPGDPSLLGRLIHLVAYRHMPVFAFRDSVVSWVHVEDVARGLIRAAERGTPGEDYILGGENESISGLLARIGRITGVRPPRAWLSYRAMKAMIPLGSVVSRIIGQAPGVLEEVYRTLDGSLAFSSTKAQRELGYTYRSVEEGFGSYLGRRRRDWLR
ncbi:MAG: NAD-dependent epimerase/dehydratase family protein [Actinomycetota bacterium]